MKKGGRKAATVQEKPKVEQRPVYLQGQDIPSDLDYVYIVGKNGFFLRKRTKLYTATVAVDEVPSLGECAESCYIRKELPLIPYSLLMEAHEFFGCVYGKHKSEAIVLLMLSDEGWSLHPPEQEVGAGSVDYKNDIRESGLKSVFAGTIHSHCEMGAFYSGTDNRDDAQVDGLHIVLGRITQSKPDIVTSMVINGKRFPMDSKLVIEDLPEGIRQTVGEHPWMDKVSKAGYKYGSQTAGAIGSHYNTYQLTSAELVRRIQNLTDELNEKSMEIKRLEALIAAASRTDSVSLPVDSYDPMLQHDPSYGDL